MFETGLKIDAEDGAERRHREKNRGQDSEPMGRNGQLVSRGGLRFGLQCCGVAESVLGILVGELRHAFDLVRPVTADENFFASGHQLACVLQGGVQVAAGPDQRCQGRDVGMQFTGVFVERGPFVDLGNEFLEFGQVGVE